MILKCNIKGPSPKLLFEFNQWNLLGGSVKWIQFLLFQKALELEAKLEALGRQRPKDLCELNTTLDNMRLTDGVQILIGLN